jgi:hypothetical protein
MSKPPDKPFTGFLPEVAKLKVVFRIEATDVIKQQVNGPQIGADIEKQFGVLCVSQSQADDSVMLAFQGSAERIAIVERALRASLKDDPVLRAQAPQEVDGFRVLEFVLNRDD